MAGARRARSSTGTGRRAGDGDVDNPGNWASITMWTAAVSRSGLGDDEGVDVETQGDECLEER